MLTVTVSEKGGQQSTFEFSRPEITIGRMKGNDIVLPKGNVSKRHSRIFVKEGQISIVDLESTNGTYVNGRKITTEQSLSDSDKIYIGDFILQVDEGADARPGSMPPSPPPGGGDGGYRNRQPSGAQPSQDRSSSHAGANSMPERNMSATEFDPQGDRHSSGSGSNPPGPPQPPAGGGGAAGGNSGGSPSLDFDDLDFAAGGGGASGGPGGGGPDAGGPGGSPDAGGLGGGPGAGGLGGGPGAGGPGKNSGAGSPGGGGPGGGGPGGGPGGRNPGSGSGSHAPTPEPRRPDVGAPRLQGDWQSRPQDDATVDRLGDRMMPQPEYSQVSTVLATNEMESEFDPDFHAAQHDVARVLFESVSAQDLPLDYPPTQEGQDRFSQAVRDAIGTVNPRVDREELANLMTSECVGLGPLEFYLDDPEIRDVYVNRFDQILIRRAGRMIVAPRAFSHPQLLQAAAYRLLGPREVEVLTDELRFNDGTKVHVVMPPLAVDGPAITVRKPPTSFPTLDDLVDSDVLSSGMAEFLLRATEAGRSILIAGPTSAGKSTLLSALAREIPSGVRMVGVEESAHLNLPPNAVRLEANPSAGYDMRSVLRSALAMHPQRILLDECRGAEAYDWVTAAACGTEGSMMTLHGTSAADSLGRLESLCLLGSTDVSPRGLREQIARAVNIAVVVNRVSDHGFRVQQITEVQGVDLDAFRLNDVFYYRVEGADGAFHPTGYIPLFYEDLRHAGADVDFGIFRE